MGHVKRELRNEGRGLHEWDYVSLSEHRVVATLIKNRRKVDSSYYMKLFGAVQHPLVSQGIAPFSEPITVTYLDLDKLIDTCGLTRAERTVINTIMFGYSFNDVADSKNTSVQAVNQLFNRAVDKVVKRNNLDWQNFHCNSDKCV